MKGNIRYYRELQKTYLIAEDCLEELLESYFGRAVLHTAINGLAACREHLVNGKKEIWYEIDGFHTLEQIFAVKKISAQELKQILLGLAQTIEELKKYLIDGKRLCYQPEYLYMDMETGKLKLLFDFTERDREHPLMPLAEFLLERLDHEEEAAVELGYFFYEQAGRDVLSIREIEKKAEGSVLYEGKDAKGEDLNGALSKAVLRENLMEEKQEIRTACGASKELFPEEEENIFPDRLYEQSFSKEKVQEPLLGEGRYLTKGGAVVTVMALLLGGSFFLVKAYFSLTETEELIWLVVSAVLLLMGAGVSIYMFLRERRAGAVRNKGSEQGDAAIRESTQENVEIKNMQRNMEIRENTQKNAVISRNVQKDAEYRKDIQSNAIGESPYEEYGQEIDFLPKETDGKTIYLGDMLAKKEYVLVGENREYKLDTFPFLIGKDKERVTLMLKDRSVSRIHARFLLEEGILYLEDLHSTNGTYLNDLLLEPHVRMKVKRGDFLQFGKTELSLR